MVTTVIRVIETALKYGSSNLFTDWSLTDIGRFVRNGLLIIIYGYSFLLPFVTAGLFIIWIKKINRKLMILFLSFLIPFFLTAKFWYGGLYGRYSSLIAYGFALMIALIPNRIIYWLIILSICLTFIPTFIAFQKKPIPVVQKEMLKQLKISENDLIILSDYQRPQLSFKNTFYINGNADLTKTVENKILSTLKNNQKVFISRQAVTFPYWQYDGQQIHIVSKGNINKAVLKKFLADKNLTKVAELKNYPLLSIYQLDY